MTAPLRNDAHRAVFPSDHRAVGHVPPVFAEVIEAEPMVFSGSIKFARANGGPITRRVLREFDGLRAQKRSDHFWVVDTRVQMLMPGQYPAIPGWHCDAVPRSDYNDQPDPRRITGTAHYAVAMTDPLGVCETEFVDDEVECRYDPAAVWQSVHDAVEEQRSGASSYEDGTLVRFSQTTIHRATPAESRCWRFWMRISEYPRSPLNKVRKQVQVYTTEGGGW